MRFWVRTVSNGTDLSEVGLLETRRIEVPMASHQDGLVNYLSIQMTEEDEVLILRHLPGVEPECVYSEVKS